MRRSFAGLCEVRQPSEIRRWLMREDFVELGESGSHKTELWIILHFRAIRDNSFMTRAEIERGMRLANWGAKKMNEITTWNVSCKPFAINGDFSRKIL